MTPTLVKAALVAIVLSLLAWPLAALGQEAPCRREGDRVSCSSDGFKALTDAAVKARAEAATCTLRLEDTAKDVGARETALFACEAALAAIPPCPPPPEKAKATRFVVGYAAGIVATVAILTGALAPLPDAARLTLGGAGLAGLAGGIVLVLP